MMMVIEVPPQKSELELNFTNDYTHPRVVRLHKEAANTKKKKKKKFHMVNNLLVQKGQ